MYNVNIPKKLNNPKTDKKKPIIIHRDYDVYNQDDELSDKETLLENNTLDDDYDAYKLLKEQSIIIDNLKELEDQLLSDKMKPKVVYETPKGYLDSSMKPNKHLLTQELLERKSSTKIQKSYFHGNILML
jgi:hypothetical protein